MHVASVDFDIRMQLLLSNTRENVCDTKDLLDQALDLLNDMNFCALSGVGGISSAIGAIVGKIPGFSFPGLDLSVLFNGITDVGFNIQALAQAHIDVQGLMIDASSKASQAASISASDGSDWIDLHANINGRDIDLLSGLSGCDDRNDPPPEPEPEEEPLGETLVDEDGNPIEPEPETSDPGPNLGTSETGVVIMVDGQAVVIEELTPEEETEAITPSCTTLSDIKQDVTADILNVGEQFIKSALRWDQMIAIANQIEKISDDIKAKEKEASETVDKIFAIAQSLKKNLCSLFDLLDISINALKAAGLTIGVEGSIHIPTDLENAIAEHVQIPLSALAAVQSFFAALREYLNMFLGFLAEEEIISLKMLTNILEDTKERWGTFTTSAFGTS